MQHPGYAPLGCKVFHRGGDGRPLGIELRYEGMPYRVTVKYNPRIGVTQVCGFPGAETVPRDELIKFLLDAVALTHKQQATSQLR